VVEAALAVLVQAERSTPRQPTSRAALA